MRLLNSLVSALKTLFSGLFYSDQKKMLNLILFGPPGSGKGTQAAKISEKYKLLHISTGDLFRYEMGNDTALGLEAKAYMAKGMLVPDEVTIGMLKNKVEAKTLPKAIFLTEIFLNKTKPKIAIKTIERNVYN